MVDWLRLLSVVDLCLQGTMGKKKSEAGPSKPAKKKQKSKAPSKPKTRSSQTKRLSPSSSSSPIPSPIPSPIRSSIPPTQHPFLHFTTPDHFDRYTRLRIKPFEPNRCLHWPTLQNLGIADRIRTMLDESGWSAFFDINEVTYKELTLEFFSTYTLDKSSNLVDAKTIKFQLGGQPHNITITEFGVLCGFYTREYTQLETYLDSPVDFPEDLDPHTFWHSIGEGPYQPHRTKSTQLRDPVYRILHRLIAHTISGRKGSSSVVSQRDLFYLFSVITPFRCNIASCFAWYLTLIADRRRSGSLTGGSFITALARQMGILTPAVLSTLHVECPMIPIDLETLRKMQMLLPLPEGGFTLQEPAAYDVPDPMEADIPHLQSPFPQQAPPDSAPQHSPLLHASPAPEAGPSTAAPPPIFTGFPYTTAEDEDRKPNALEKQLNRMEVTIDRIARDQDKQYRALKYLRDSLYILQDQLDYERRHTLWLEETLGTHFKALGMPFAPPPPYPTPSTYQRPSTLEDILDAEGFFSDPVQPSPQPSRPSPTHAAGPSSAHPAASDSAKSSSDSD